MSDGMLIPAERSALTDWRTFVARALHADEDAAIRLAVTKDVLVLTVAPLHPKGLSDSMPLVLGMRMLRLQNLSMDGLDVVVEARALLDRFARIDAVQKPFDVLSDLSADAGHAGADTVGEGDGATPGIAVPPAEVRVPWTGISPPRGPWEPLGTVSADSLRGVAEAGIEEVAKGTPENAGSHAVDALRRQVWSRTALEVGFIPASSDVEHSRPIPAGAAFGLYTLGFLPATGSAHVLRCGVWTRISLPAGHVLIR